MKYQNICRYIRDFKDSETQHIERCRFNIVQDGSSFCYANMSTINIGLFQPQTNYKSEESMNYILRISVFVFSVILSSFNAHSMETSFKVVSNEQKFPRYELPSEVHLTMSLITGKDSKEIAQSHCVVYKDVPFEKKSWVLESHFFTSHEFKELFSQESNNMIIFDKMQVNKKNRSKELEKSLLLQTLGYISQHYSGSTMVWYAFSHGDKCLTLEELCTFFENNECIQLGHDQQCVRFCKKIQ